MIARVNSLHALASLAVLSVMSNGLAISREPRQCVYQSFCGPVQPVGRQQMRAALRQAEKAVRKIGH